MSPTSTRTIVRLTPSLGRTAADLAGRLADALDVLLVLTGTYLIARRFAGALAEPLDGGTLLAAGVVIVALTVLVRRLATLGERRGWRVGPTVSLLLIGGALSMPGTSGLVIGLVWVMIAVEEAWAWGGVRWLRRTHLAAGLAPARAPSSDAAKSNPTTNVELEPEDFIGAAEADPQATQRLERTESVEEGDVLRGWVRTALVAEQRTCHVHVAFCPPFASVPELEFHQTEGPAARIKAAQVLPYGVRWDVKLNSPGPAQVAIEFAAVCVSHEPAAQAKENRSGE